MVFERDDYFEEIYDGIRIEDLSDVRFDNCRFVNCDLSNGVFARCKFVECEFEQCDISLAKLNDSVFNDVTFKTSKATGLRWYLCNTNQFDVKFIETNLSMSSFHDIDLRGAEFRECKLEDVDFEETNLQSVSFNGSDLTNASFANTNLKDTDLSGAINYAIDPNNNYLKATKVSLSEAMSFLKFLDIKIVK